MGYLAPDLKIIVYKLKFKDGFLISMKNIVAVDLFCGADGLTKGHLDAGIDVYASYILTKMLYNILI